MADNLCEARDIEAAWAAGFFDGEGGTYFHGPDLDYVYGKGSGRVSMKVSQTERGPLDRFQSAVGVGKVHGPYPSKRGYRDVYRWEVTGYAAIQEASWVLWPYLSQVKRTQMLSALERKEAALAKMGKNGGPEKDVVTGRFKTKVFINNGR
jgi:hypothetical protein